MKSQLRVAVIGTGVMGSLYARILKQTRAVDLVAVCGRTPDRVDKVAFELGVPGYSGADYARLFAEHPGLDGVVIATPEAEHAGPVKASLLAGANVLVEKPLALNLDEAAELTELGRRTAKTMMVCHHLRFDPRCCQLARLVQEGTIGKVTNIYARRNPPSASPRRIAGRVSPVYWVGVHDIDLVHWITGQRGVRVFAKAAGSHLRSLDLDVDDCIVSIVTLSDGSLLLLENSWATPRTQGRPRSFTMAIRGTQGTVELDGNEHGLTAFSETSVRSCETEVLIFPELYGRPAGVYRDMMDHFIDCVTTGRTPVVTAEDGLAAVRVADAMVRSIEQRKEVDVPWS